ncbi:MAG: hypothetical protein ACKVK6_05185 [bacterium]
MNPTAEKFGYPDSLVASFEHWHVLVRPAQPTIGSLVLVCSDPVGSFGEISPEASIELQLATAAIERVLGEMFAIDKINYLMLMMVDPDGGKARPVYLEPEIVVSPFALHKSK